jgi:hypothetical protein
MRRGLLRLVLVSAAILAVGVGFAAAQRAFQMVTGKELDKAFIKDFYLEGNSIPVERRNFVMVTAGGSRVLAGLLDTTGYSSQIRQKYIGMLITETDLSVCGKNVHVGSFGMGIDRPGESSQKDATFFLYNQAGEKVLECSSKHDAQIATPRPLQILLAQGVPARLYLGRFWVVLK